MRPAPHHDTEVAHRHLRRECNSRLALATSEASATAHCGVRTNAPKRRRRTGADRMLHGRRSYAGRASVNQRPTTSDSQSGWLRTDPGEAGARAEEGGRGGVWRGPIRRVVNAAPLVLATRCARPPYRRCRRHPPSVTPTRHTSGLSEPPRHIAANAWGGHPLRRYGSAPTSVPPRVLSNSPQNPLCAADRQVNRSAAWRCQVGP